MKKCRGQIVVVGEKSHAGRRTWSPTLQKTKGGAPGTRLHWSLCGGPKPCFDLRQGLAQFSASLGREPFRQRGDRGDDRHVVQLHQLFGRRVWKREQDLYPVREHSP